jgi:hypothetical protein
MTAIRYLITCGVYSGLLGTLSSCLTAAEDDESVTADTAAVIVPPTVIASGQSAPLGVQVDATTAFWINSHLFTGDPADIVSTPKAGGGPVTLVEDKIPDLGLFELDADRIYWPQGGVDPGVGGIRSKPKTGGAPVTVVANRRVFALALSGPHIYFASPDGGGKILRVAKTGGAITTLASGVGPGLDNIPLVAVTSDKVFFTQATFGVECDGMVRFVPKTGGAIKNVAKDVCNLIGLAADATAVYWTEFDSAAQVGRVMKQNAPFTGQPIVLDTVAIQPFFLELSDTSVYYTAGTIGDAGVLAKLPKTGGTRQTLAVDQQFPTTPSLDGTHVYWTTVLDGEVKRVPK